MENRDTKTGFKSWAGGLMLLAFLTIIALIPIAVMAKERLPFEVKEVGEVFVTKSLYTLNGLSPMQDLKGLSAYLNNGIYSRLLETMRHPFPQRF